MGFFDELGGLLKEGISSSLGMSDTGADTIHNYTYEEDEDLRFDDEYVAVFAGAIKSLHQEHIMDNYIADLLLPGWHFKEAEVAEDVECTDSVLWRICYEKGRGEDSRCVSVRLETPNAQQFQWDGSELCRGYVVDWHERHTLHNVLGRFNDDGISEFFGVKFGDDYHSYADAGAKPENIGEKFHNAIDCSKIECPFECRNKVVFYNAKNGRISGLMVLSEPVEDVDEYLEEIVSMLSRDDRIDLEKKKADQFFDDGSEGYVQILGKQKGLILVTDMGDQVMVQALTDAFLPSENSTSKPEITKLESFLGVKFGEDYHKFQSGHGIPEAWKFGLRRVSADLNKFMDFEDESVLLPSNRDVIIGVYCRLNSNSKAIVGPQYITSRIYDYMKRIKSILEEKYQRECVKTETGYEMYFREDEDDVDSRVLSKITLALDEDADELSLMAIDVEAQERIADPDMRRKDAIDAL